MEGIHNLFRKKNEEIKKKNSWHAGKNINKKIEKTINE